MPAPLEFVRHPESTPANPDITLPDTPTSNSTDDSNPMNCPTNPSVGNPANTIDPMNYLDEDNPTSRILSTPRHSAWPD